MPRKNKAENKTDAMIVMWTKLAKARGMLYSVKVELDDLAPYPRQLIEDIDKVLKVTVADPPTPDAEFCELPGEHDV